MDVDSGLFPEFTVPEMLVESRSSCPTALNRPAEKLQEHRDGQLVATSDLWARIRCSNGNNFVLSERIAI
jgi:hypothetical protein